VEHLKSDITAVGNTKTHLLKVAKSLHPTPAVSGLPRAAALKFLAEWEPFDRSAYAGFFGLENNSNQSGIFYVNLRCMRIKADTLTLYAGGGINSESNAVAEWEETVTKLSTLKSVL
jgi:isochorismate synthase